MLKRIVFSFVALCGIGIAYAGQDLWGGVIYDAFKGLYDNELVNFGKSDRGVTSLEDLRNRALALKNALDSFMSKELANVSPVSAVNSSLPQTWASAVSPVAALASVSSGASAASEPSVPAKLPDVSPAASAPVVPSVPSGPALAPAPAPAVVSVVSESSTPVISPVLSVPVVPSVSSGPALAPAPAPVEPVHADTNPAPLALMTSPVPAPLSAAPALPIATVLPTALVVPSAPA